MNHRAMQIALCNITVSLTAAPCEKFMSEEVPLPDSDHGGINWLQGGGLKTWVPPGEVSRSGERKGDPGQP